MVKLSMPINLVLQISSRCLLVVYNYYFAYNILLDMAAYSKLRACGIMHNGWTINGSKISARTESESEPTVRPTHVRLEPL